MHGLISAHPQLQHSWGTEGAGDRGHPRPIERGGLGIVLRGSPDVGGELWRSSAAEGEHHLRPESPAANVAEESLRPNGGSRPPSKGIGSRQPADPRQQTTNTKTLRSRLRGCAGQSSKRNYNARNVYRRSESWMRQTWASWRWARRSSPGTGRNRSKPTTGTSRNTRRCRRRGVGKTRSSNPGRPLGLETPTGTG